MTVFILDMDWIFDKNDMPNPDCMRLSSFHKQRGDKVYFVGDMTELAMTYDKLYVFSSSDSTPMLSSKIMNDERTTLFGTKFALCGAKKLGTVIMSCRPDYLLYDIKDEKSNSYARANFITFFVGNDKIKRRQEWKNTKKGAKRTIVTDDCLWKQKPELIIQCLAELQEERNIAFLNPISLKVLVENKEVRNFFVNLHFMKGTIFKWRNDLGSDDSSAAAICEFFYILKQHTKSNVGRVPLLPTINNNWEEDLERLLKAISIFKQNKVKCFLPPLSNTSHPIYSWLTSWLDKGWENSFIEEMVFFDVASKGTRWMNVINTPSFWQSKKTRFLIKLLDQNKWQNLIPYMTVQIGFDAINPNVIDFDIIKQNAYMII
jgi:hypothetical protein